MRVPWHLSLAIVLSAVSSRSEPADPAAAEALFRAGREAAERGDAGIACSRFEESYRLDPAPGTLLNIAKCEEALGRLAEAWEHYSRLLDEIEGSDPRRPTIRQRLSALELRLPKLTIRPQRGASADTVVRRDGVLVNQGGFGVPLPVDPGDHELVVTAPGRAPKSYSVRLAEGEKRTVEVEAGPLEAVEAPAPRPVPREPVDLQRRAHSPEQGARTHPLRTVGFVSLGAGAASALAAGVLFWRYEVERGVVEEQCNTALQCRDDGLRAAGAASVLQTATIVAAAATLTFAGVGVGLLWAHPSGESGKPMTVGSPSGVVASGAF